MTMPTFNDGKTGFASCKGAIPTFAGGRTAAGKYLLWAYRNWKQHFVVASGSGFKVVRPDTGDNNDTVSEGIGYGMLLAVYFNDKTLFDGLWAYAQQNTASGLLMTWHIPGGNGSATDADEDMAFALVEAGKQWGTSYTTTAGTMISQIAAKDIDWTDNLPTGGSNYGNTVSASEPTNPSYFAPAYYRVFAGIDTAHNWSSLADNTIKVISSLSGSNGLVPAWCGASCAAPASNSGSLNPATDEIYQYDAQRVPWRVGVDYCWNGTAAAASYLSKISAFFAGQAAGGIGALYDEYSLSGAPYTGAVANSMSLIGSAAVGAMSGSNGTFVNEAWQMVLDGINRGEPNLVATKNTYYTYYNATVGLLTALTLSGNFYSM
jgi:endo-1,4-beta-D-glucanase Y